MTIKREDAEAFVDRFLEASPKERGDLYRQLSAMTGISERELEQYLQSETDRSYLIERIELFEGGDLQKDRAGLVAVVQRVIDGEGSVAQIDEWLRVIAANVPAPISYVSDLIFNADPAPGAEEVVEKALAYRPPDAILV